MATVFGAATPGFDDAEESGTTLPGAEPWLPAPRGTGVALARVAARGGLVFTLRDAGLALLELRPFVVVAVFFATTVFPADRFANAVLAVTLGDAVRLAADLLAPGFFEIGFLVGAFLPVGAATARVGPPAFFAGRFAFDVAAEPLRAVFDAGEGRLEPGLTFPTTAMARSSG